MIATTESLNVEDELAKQMAKLIAQEIDFELLADALAACGWTKVVLKRGALPCTGVELHEWRESNLTGRWKANDNIWVFENPKDALIFTLRWS